MHALHKLLHWLACARVMPTRMRLHCMPHECSLLCRQRFVRELVRIAALLICVHANAIKWCTSDRCKGTYAFHSMQSSAMTTNAASDDDEVVVKLLSGLGNCDCAV